MPLLLGKKGLAIGDNEAEIARAGLIDPGKIHFIQNAVAQRKPDLAVLVQCRPSSGFGAERSSGVVYRASRGRSMWNRS